MGKIWIAGVGFDIDARVIAWHEYPYFDATKETCVSTPKNHMTCVTAFSPGAKNRNPKRYALRPALRSMGMRPTLSACQSVIRQFILHHDGCADAEMCFNVLQNERGLSCHFLLDNDGTIYQTMDLAYMAYHAAAFNTNSIGIEISNRGDAKLDLGYYAKKNQKRDIVTCRINDHTYLTFNFTPPQYDAMKALARGLARALPNLPLEYPQDAPGHQAWKTLANPWGFAGYLGHYHTTTRKWDPGPFDFKTFCEKMRGSLCFPLFVRPSDADVASARPEVPEDGDALGKATDELYKMNEEKAEGGFFPVGPYGETRLWHGGVHLATKLKAPVFAPFPGRLMAARMSTTPGIGSTSFALLRHDMTIGEQRMRFFTLYYHLFDELKAGPGDADGGKAPEWMKSPGWVAKGKPGEVVILDEPLEAGAVLGRVGLAGPPDVRRAQLHFEVFAEDEILGKLGEGTWTILDGTSGGRFSDRSEINELIDQDKDGALSRRELVSFFSGPGERNLTRRMAVYAVSEWTSDPDWLQSLQLAPDYRGQDPKQLAEDVEEQITPGLWWTEAVANAVGLPADGVVYHYHPITFLRFINEKLLEARLMANDGVGAFDESQAQEAPTGVTDDFGDTTGESAVSEDELGGRAQETLRLEDLVEGFKE